MYLPFEDKNTDSNVIQSHLTKNNSVSFYIAVIKFCRVTQHCNYLPALFCDLFFLVKDTKRLFAAVPMGHFKAKFKTVKTFFAVWH